MRYTAGDASQIMSFTPEIGGVELHPPASKVYRKGVPLRSNVAARVCIFILFYKRDNKWELVIDVIPLYIWL